MSKLSLHHDDPAIGDIEFVYHPESISRQYDAGWNRTTVAGSDDPLLVWSGGAGKEFSFTAEFVGESGRKNAEKLWLAGQAAPHKNGTLNAPPIWKLVSGKRVIPVVIQNLNFEQSYFNKELEADLVTVQISLIKYRPYLISAKGV